MILANLSIKYISLQRSVVRSGIQISLFGMRIVIDEKIPYLCDALLSLGHRVAALPGVGITKEALQGAEALFVRTRTRCDAGLLEGTSVRFIGTATIGYDHIDAGYCREKGIVWTNAAGCNAGAVLQYVQSVVYTCFEELSGLSMGIVGVGEIGSRVARWASESGMKVLLNDPPREERGETGFSTLEEIARECDIITFHPTLERGGKYPSYHLADEAFFSSLRRCKLLINASRGPVVDNQALLSAIESGRLQHVALDVWENEPQINLSLLNKVYIATPHIAGYSAEGKINATGIVLEAFLHFINYKGDMPELALSAPANDVVEASSLREALLGIYSPLGDTLALKSNPGDFEKLRNGYNLRREPSAYSIVISPKIG